MLKGLMQDRPLLVSQAIDYGAEIHPGAGLVSATIEGDIHRIFYPDLHRRICRLAHALRALGIKFGDRVATLAWNGYRHFELYYAITGIGAVCHTLNPRLSAEQFAYITHHAEDRALFFDVNLAGLVGAMRETLPDMHYVAMCGAGHMPEMDDVHCYEDMLSGQPDTITWPDLDENTACSLCYTSGTTGVPKGVLYSHRGMILHSLFASTIFQNTFRQGRRIFPVVPLFHANAWGLPYAAPLFGMTMVMPGVRVDGKSVFELMDAEDVYAGQGVPTVWLALLEEMDRRGRKPGQLSEMVIGGSAASRAIIERFEIDYGIDVIHGWGMTEMSPIGTTAHLTPEMRALPDAERIDLKELQGRRMFGVDLRIVADDGTVQPNDGISTGEIRVRGPCIASGYFNNEEASAAQIDGDGWLKTGDIGAVRPDGFLVISDRAKDLIKSGGEWISSLDVENIAMSHPAIANCAVIGVPHPKWDERPLLVAMPAGDPVDADLVRAHIGEHVAKWQIPDDVVWVDELPLTATGKVSKRELREIYKDHPMERAPQ